MNKKQQAANPPRSGHLRSFFLKLLSLCLAITIWLPVVHIFFQPDMSQFRSESSVPRKAQMLARQHIDIWTNTELRKTELEKMQQRNPEWDFMSRTYFVLALANMALIDHEYKSNACAIIDAIVDNTIQIEKERGPQHFLLDYGRVDLWVVKPAASQFVDGEIALMLAARRLVEEKSEYAPMLSERVEKMILRMKQSPVLCAESYPDECWLFCNAVSLAAIRMSDILDDANHQEFLTAWIQTAKTKLLDSKSGLLISAYGVDGTPAPCGFSPEGSSIWMAVHMLQIVDPEFARQQYEAARKELFRSFFGFGYSREWTAGSPGEADVDSGPLIPLLEASASASGLGLIAASAFDDDKVLRSLLTSLNCIGFPTERNGRLIYKASNPVGDAVLLYALTEGPLWKEIHRRIMS